MLVLKAFPLSLSILVRLVVVFPVMLIALFFYGLAGGIVGGLANLILPGIYPIALFLISASSTIIPMMVGSRMGFQAHQVVARTGYRKLIPAALLYGSFEAVCLALTLVPFIGFHLTQVLPSLTDLTQLSDTDLTGSIEEFVTSITGTNPVFVLVLWAGVAAVRSLILVPIASASIGLDPDKSAYTPFRNFGSSFLPLFLLTLLSYGLAIVFYVIAFVVFAALNYEDTTGTLAASQGAGNSFWQVAGLFFAFLLIGLWALSLQCAGGVLAYLKLRGDDTSLRSIDAPQQTVLPGKNLGPRMSPEELRAMRKSRQAGRS